MSFRIVVKKYGVRLSILFFFICCFFNLTAQYSGGIGGGNTMVFWSAVPTAPTNLLAESGDGQVSVAFSPGSAGETPISNYEYSTNNGTTWVVCSPAIVSSPIVIGGLTNGTIYAVKIRAINSIGSGFSSSAINVTPGLPSPPTNLTATPSNGQVSISFTEGSNSGSAITNYEYAINGGTFTSCNPVDNTSPVVISGLTNGIQYTFQLRAVNSIV